MLLLLDVTTGEVRPLLLLLLLLLLVLQSLPLLRLPELLPLLLLLLTVHPVWMRISLVAARAGRFSCG